MYKTILITCAALAALGSDARDGRAEYEELVAAFRADHARYFDAAGVVPPLLPAESPYHTKFLVAAERHAGTDAALPFLGWVLQNAPRNPEAHGAAVAAIDALAKSAAEDLRAAGGVDEDALYKDSRKAVQHLKYNDVSDEVFARTLLDTKVLARVANSDGIREASERSIFKLQNLRPGMVAPEIEGADLDGASFKLSDYRGKVVVVDFWGDW